MKVILYKYLVFAFLILWGIKVFSNNALKQNKISRDEALCDLDSLMQNIEEIHPNAYAFTSQEEIEEEYNKIKSLIEDSISIYKYYQYLSYVAAKYNDGHISIIYPTQWYKLNNNFIPITVDIDYPTKQIFVNSTDSNHIALKGAKILEINNVPVHEIIDTMTVCQSGESVFFRTERCERYFSQLLYSIYSISGSYSLKIKKDKELEIIDLNGIDYHEFKKINSNSEFSNFLYNAELLNNNTFLIDFRDFSDLKKFKIFLDSSFKLIKEKEVNNLIIDIRNNSGGDSRLGDKLLKYIANDPFTQYGKMEWKISQQLKDLWKNYYSQQGFIMKLYARKINRMTNGELIIENNNKLIRPNKKSKRFRGDIYLLTSSYTFSSAADFAWCFKHYDIGKIIGEETGGWGLCYGDNVYMKLPISNIPINVSCKLFYNIGAASDSFHGVIPDIHVQSEKALEEALNLINNNTL